MSDHSNSYLAVATGYCLAFLGAGVNSCYFVGIGTSVSHLTGDVSKVALAVADRQEILSSAVLHLVAAALGFVSGATAAGFFIHQPRMDLSRPYGHALILVGLGLAGAQLLLDVNELSSIALAGIACGFQNALATHYRGMVLRTTHVTGLLTDLGTSLGMRFRGHQVPAWKIAIPLFLSLSFFLGALAGCAAYLHMPQRALFGYALLYGALGCLWVFIRSRTGQDIRED